MCGTPRPLAAAGCHSVCTWLSLSQRPQVPCPLGALLLWTAYRMTPLLIPGQDNRQRVNSVLTQENSIWRVIQQMSSSIVISAALSLLLWWTGFCFSVNTFHFVNLNNVSNVTDASVHNINLFFTVGMHIFLLEHFTSFRLPSNQEMCCYINDNIMLIKISSRSRLGCF